jgi:pSer/pThr/pTyr-binding forkhead associated (FHA) protein
MAALVGMSEEVKGQRIELEDSEFTIGRATDNTMPISAGSVSGHHCRFYVEDDQFVLEDLDSTNGTRVNGRRIHEPTHLYHHNLLQIGDVEFIFEDEGAEGKGTTGLIDTDVEVDTGEAAAPVSFTNISPFNTRKKETKGLWITVITILTLLALGSMGFFIWTFMNLK